MVFSDTIKPGIGVAVACEAVACEAEAIMNNKMSKRVFIICLKSVKGVFDASLLKQKRGKN